MSNLSPVPSENSGNAGEAGNPPILPSFNLVTHSVVLDQNPQGRRSEELSCSVAQSSKRIQVEIRDLTDFVLRLVYNPKTGQAEITTPASAPQPIYREEPQIDFDALYLEIAELAGYRDNKPVKIIFFLTQEYYLERGRQEDFKRFLQEYIYAIKLLQPYFKEKKDSLDKSLESYKALFIKFQERLKLPIDSPLRIKNLTLRSEMCIKLPPNIEGFQELESLEVNFSALTHIQPEVQRLKNLRKLDIGYNPIYTLEGLENMPSLREIIFARSTIDGPDRYFDFKKMSESLQDFFLEKNPSGQYLRILYGASDSILNWPIEY